MSTEIKCPNCGHQFEPNESIREEVEKELRSKMVDWQKQKEKQLEENIRKNLATDYETQLRLLQENNKSIEEKLKEARQKEADFLRKQQELKTKEAEIDLTVQKQLQRDREKLTDDIRKIEEQKVAAKETDYLLKIKELEKQRDDQKKLADEMRRKAEQGSMQLQGEVQELALEEMLKIAFPFDIITEVGKGVRGADCIQTVRNNIGLDCGKIIFESKRTTNFSNEWIEKLKTDMRSQGADVAVLVTQVFPKDMDSFGEKDGIWICNFNEVKPIVQLLRSGILKISTALKSQNNKGDKIHLLYDYLTSREFAEQWQAIREGFMSMKISIQKERDAMEKLWKQREKQLEKVLLSAAHVRGSIEGISGNDVDLNLLGEAEGDSLID